MAHRILLFYGSVRTQREGIKAARFMRNVLSERGHEVTLVDPKDYDFGLLDYMYKEYPGGSAPAPGAPQKPGEMEELAELVRTVDAFVVVSGEYNHSIPPALSNLMDHFLEEYAFRPAGIVSYSAGMFGGMRAAMQLRSFLAEVGTVTIPTIFPIPKVQDAFEEDGTPVSEKTYGYVRGFLDELEWYAEVLKQGRENVERP